MDGPANSDTLRFGKLVVEPRYRRTFLPRRTCSPSGQAFPDTRTPASPPKTAGIRSEIIRTVWPGIFIEGDLCLNVAIRRLRAALQDDTAHPHFIETVGSHGYRFIAAIIAPRLWN